MADNLLFKIASELDEKGFKAAAKEVRNIKKRQDEAGKSTDKWKGKTDLLKGAWQGLIGIGIISFFKSAVDEQVKVERSQFLLGQRVENTGKKWADLKANVMEYNAAMSQMTGVAEDEINDALARLIDSMGDVGKAQEFLGATLGLARAQGLSYATAAEQVGRASLGVAEFTKTLAERIGITGEKSRDAEFVLATLQKRFGTLAQDEDTAAKGFAQFNNEMKKWKEEIGSGVIPAVQKVMEWLRRLARAGSAAMDLLIIRTIQYAEIQMGAFRAIKQAARLNFKAAQVEIAATMRVMKDLNVEAKAAGEAMKAAFTEPLDAIDKLPETVERGVKAFQPLTARFLKMQAEFRAGQAQNDADRLKQLNEALEQEKGVRAAAIDAQMAAEEFSLKQREDMIKESNAAINAAIERNNRAALAKRAALYQQFGNILGVATAKGLQGDVNAWKQASIQIIDIIAQQTQAIVMANAIAGASQEVKKHGIAGIATGALALGWGAIQVAGIAALAQAAKGAIGGGGDAGAPAPSAPAAATAAAAPAATAQQPTAQGLTVIVQGDFIGEEQWVANLAQRLNQTVENKGTRLVATQTISR